MTDEVFIEWIRKIDKNKLDALHTFAVQSIFITMKYLDDKKFTIHDFQKVLDDFLLEGGERTTQPPQGVANAAPFIPTHPDAEQTL